ncbi:3-hydroxyacyl-CoA dehydrogenase family protein [Halobacillus litoralis]|uniref:3-hydroxyacyl-CoA dehydrogenase family protein n=1 Tax=Halobacillus litoralis TaxID=45668 RepID=UPI001CFCAA76|nr:3-hydroxyacyl-CoA dehydrogenase family protein [Halobacillus litoralis]WLR49181.1 3-hydroxyacyl-CoA dehydrogenase family protein [Halobacillus litoralis]
MESNNPIHKVAVIGAGAMGSQIAMVCALQGHPVYLNDLDPQQLKQAEIELKKRMERSVEKKRLTEEQVHEAFHRLELGTELSHIHDADLVIEAVVEKLEVKRDLFKKLDEVTAPHAILATNSSTIVSSKIADVTTRPERVCNLHFFNPPLIMELVEVVKGPHTSEETAERAFQFIEGIGKTPVMLQKEISGFIANRILGKLMDEAVYLLENGYATHEEIDKVCTKALNHPIGPFSLMDLTGIDVNYFVRMQRYEETGNENDRPAKIVEDKVKKGELGRKTGQGFYQYT